MKHGCRLLLGLALLATPSACGDDEDGRDATDTSDEGEIFPDGDVPGDVPGETEGEAEAEGEADAPDPADDGGTDVPAACAEPTGSCAGEACHAPPYALHCVGGTVRDGAGEPLGGQMVALCAAGHCYSARSRPDGWFAASIPASVASVENIAVYFPSDPPRHTPFCRFEALCDGTVELCAEFRLYEAPAGVDLPFGALPSEVRIEAADGGAIVLPAGVEVLPPIGAPQSLALTRFPLAEHVPCFLDRARLPTALYVVTAVDTEIIEPGTMTDPVLRPAGLDLPNETGLPAGAVVDVYVLGGAHPQDAGLEEGEWAAAATATVSADGTRIRTADGEGIAYLTWFGIYPR